VFTPECYLDVCEHMRVISYHALTIYFLPIALESALQLA